jgi:hypothetical protein
MNYIESMFPVEEFPDFKEKKDEVEGAILNILKTQSKFEITGITGLFEAKKPITV